MDIITKETFKIKLQKLVEHFSDNEQYYKSSKYKEDELRQEFINPFFKALGWDMDNEQGFAPQYREVIHEDRIEIQGKPKAPDYAFKVGSDRKFFVEAKASSVRVFSEIDPAFQLRRYAWSGQLPVSILTDFEEFSVYDTTIEPKHTDKSSVARIKYINYKDYIKEADYLWNTFSKEAVWKGSFDQFAKREKKGSQLVDKSFLKEIELWRDLVAKDIANNNKLNIYELNSVVQKFIDRIIFLRIAEDRGIESYETLRNAVKSPDTYSQLLKIFSRADEKYNSSLFDLKKDELSTKIKISDKTLDRILNNLYYPKSPYEFSVIGVDILGSVYEQFLGKVIRLTKGGNAVIEEKPEVKKAGGVYYTPQYIVDYIVKNTVGELVKDKTPKDVARLKIVDPACGSGSFLIGAYNYLLNWHHKYYVENDIEKNLKAKKLFKDGEGNYFLSTQEKKNILLNNIHGVDIDPQAVEVTKLSLSLKMLEGENSETINTQYKLFADRILPDLSSNIKCGNSLIGSDYYSDKQISLLGDEEIRKVNAFDWDKEFPLVFRYGGFDAVIGNPPYIRIQGLQEDSPEQVPYLKSKYESAKNGNIDIYVMFLEKALQIMNKTGLHGYILPHKFFQADFGENVRSLIAKDKSIRRVVSFKEKQIFENATTYTCLFFMKKQGADIIEYSELDQQKNPEEYLKDLCFYNLESSTIYSNNKWNFSNPDVTNTLNKIRKQTNLLGDLVEKIFQGLATSADKIYVLKVLEEYEDKYKVFSNQLQEELYIEKGFVKKFLMGKDVHRYEDLMPKSVVIFPYLVSDNNVKLMEIDYIRKNYPLGFEYLVKNKPILEKREHGKFKDLWWAFSRPQNLNQFEQRKLVMPDISGKPELTLDEKNLYHTTTVYSLILKPQIKENYKYFLGLLNSSLFWFYIVNTGTVLSGGYMRFKTNYLRPFPVKRIDWNNSKEVELYSKVVELVDNILSLRKGLTKDVLSNEKRELTSNQLSSMEKEINNIFYTLYNLDVDETELVENTFPK